jgi:hypothetical protein
MTITIGTMTYSPSAPTPGQTVTVTIPLTGTTSEPATASFLLNGTEIESRSITVIAGAQSITKTFVAPVAGTYQFCCNVTATTPLTGSVQVTQTTPAACAISLDGTPKGTAPLTITGVSTGTHSVTFSKSGYTSQTKSVTVTAGGTATTTATLVIIPQTVGSINVTFHGDGSINTITLDGTNVGQAPLLLEDIPIGSHVVGFSMPHYTPQDVTVTVIGGQTVTATVTLAIIPGVFQFNSTPTGATITMDGVVKGVTPLTVSNVTMGTHTIVYSKTLYNPVTHSLVAQPSDMGYVYDSATLTLIPATTGTISVTSSPSGATITLDGVATGLTAPCSLTNVAAGAHTVGYSLTGYNPATVGVTVVTGSTVTAAATLTIVSGLPEYGAPSILDGYTLGGSKYGGGTQYPAYTAGVAAGSYNGRTITTWTDLKLAISQATSGAVIYISPSANLDTGSDINISIPTGVTIASNRGVAGSTGGRIFTKTGVSGWNKPIFLVTTNNVRFTGLRLEGETFSENYTGTEASYRVGIRPDSCSGFQFDNCELYGFAYAGIYAHACPTSSANRSPRPTISLAANSPYSQPWIHHCYIHGAQNTGEGYGCNVWEGDMLVEGNVFDRNRHDVTGDGETTERYTCRYNLFVGSATEITGQSHVDIHGSESSDERWSGLRYDVYNNTFYTGKQTCVHQRGKPTGEGTFIHHNIVTGNDCSFPNGVSQPFWQSYLSPDSGNVTVTNNKWNKLDGNGEVLYSSGTGIYVSGTHW